jgi:hypothetical protein
MLAINVTVTGDKIVIEGLQQLAAEMPKVVQRGLRRVVKGVHREAMDFLNGAGGASKAKTTKYTGFVRKSGVSQEFKSFAGAGAYPVPVRTGNLKRMLFFLNPGSSTGNNSKGGSDSTFSAGPMEAVVYDSAEYARTIHDSTGSSAKFQKRTYLTDALARFNRGDQIAATLEDEIRNEIKKRGLA